MPTNLDTLDILPIATGVQGKFCAGCDNRQAGIRMIPPDGKGYSGVMLVGDSGWDVELKEGRPFAGPSGQFLDKHIFRRLGVQRDAFTLTNTTWCKAPRLNFYDYAGPEATAIIEHCKPYLDDLIDRLKPKVIIPMGNVALRRICGVSGINSHQCYVCDTPYGIPAVPTFHPSFVMQDNLKLTPVMLFAFRKALEIAKSAGQYATIERQRCPHNCPLPSTELYDSDGNFAVEPCTLCRPEKTPYHASGFRPVACRICGGTGFIDASVPHTVSRSAWMRTPVDYCLDRSLPELQAWMERLGHNWELPTVFDLENPKTARMSEEDYGDDPDYNDQPIIRSGFSFREGTAATYPWVEPFISFTKYMLENTKVAIAHNFNHELTHYGRYGMTVKGRKYDTMWMFHWLQSDLPKGLEFVAPFYIPDAEPWKHLSEVDPAFYNARDNDYELRCFFGMRGWLERQGRWERFKAHCSDAAEILGEMSTAGVLVDVGARSALQDALRSEIAVLDSQIQAAIPRELLPVDWLKTGRAFTREKEPQDRTGWEPVEVKCECKRLRKSTGRCLLCDGTGTVINYRKLLPFNWNSSDQVQDYARSLNLKIPKKRGGERDENGELPDTADAKALKMWGRRKPIFLTILKAKQRSKLITTYNWELDTAGRVHGTFGYWPSTWRKAMRNPNLMTIPKRNELAAAFRRTIIASPGHVLIEADSAAIEAVLVGYCAESPRYIRACKAGIHDIFMSHVRAFREGGRGIDISLADKDLNDACRAAKKEDASRPLLEQIRDACKRCIHGTNYGLSPFGMHDEYPDEFPTQKVATELQEMYLSLFPEIKSWMRKTREQADRQTFLDNHYQYRHYFYAVTKWNSKYQRFDLGTDAKRCIAFLPQSDASAIQTEDLLTLAEDSEVRPMLRLIIHDSHVLECPLDVVDDTCLMLHRTMSRPRPELGGLTIGVEIKVGQNLADTTVWVPS